MPEFNMINLHHQNTYYAELNAFAYILNIYN